jgi:hypothetical protein
MCCESLRLGITSHLSNPGIDLGHQIKGLHLPGVHSALSYLPFKLVRVGQPVRITIDALPDKEFRGTVARIAPYATDRRGDKVYEVLVDLDVPPDSGLKWGMSTFVEIKVK